MAQIELTAVDRKIEETRTELQNLSTCEDETMRLFMTSQLESRLESLLKSKAEMEESIAKDTVTLRIYGENVQPGKINSRVLLSALGGFQAMLDSVANAMLHSPTSRGKIPERIRDITSFEIVGTFAGSFGLVLERQDDQITTFAEDSQINGVLSQMFSVLETVDDADQLLTAITPFGKRTVTHYRQWLDDLHQNNVNLQVGWINEARSNRQLHLVKENAPSIISTLDTIEKIDNEDVLLYGTLNGVNIRSRSFEMSVEGYGLVKGHAMPETLMSILDKIGTEISANMVKSISFTKAGVQNKSWYLSSVNK